MTKKDTINSNQGHGDIEKIKRFEELEKLNRDITKSESSTNKIEISKEHTHEVKGIIHVPPTNDENYFKDFSHELRDKLIKQIKSILKNKSKNTKEWVEEGKTSFKITFEKNNLQKNYKGNGNPTEAMDNSLRQYVANILNTNFPDVKMTNIENNWIIDLSKGKNLKEDLKIRVQRKKQLEKSRLEKERNILETLGFTGNVKEKFKN